MVLIEGPKLLSTINANGLRTINTGAGIADVKIIQFDMVCDHDHDHEMTRNDPARPSDPHSLVAGKSLFSQKSQNL
jgi:hypothetical protein